MQLQTALGLTLLLLCLSQDQIEGAFLQVKGAFHVHTTLSTGALPLPQVVREARRKGLDSVILTENLLLRFEYGLFPFQGLLKKVVEKPSVLQLGVERYLKEVETAQQQFPDIILVPGVEVVPYYYWSGSPWPAVSRTLRASLAGGGGWKPIKEGQGDDGGLTQWNAQKNLLIVGLSRPEDIKGIPAIGNSGILPSGRVAALKLVLAIVVIVGGIFLLRAKRERAVRLKHFTLTVQKRYRLRGAIAVAFGLFVLLDALSLPELNPYRGDLGIAPYQAVIEYAESRGGAVVWSFPEARDFGEIDGGRAGKVVIRTEPYPEALLQSRGYTAFGAIYPDTVTLTEPGRQWDQLLLEYVRGDRAQPAWGIGELGYHGPPKLLDEALTTFLVTERTPAGILAALEAGRLYAFHPLAAYHLVLEDFSLSGPGVNAWVPMGGELTVHEPAPLRVRVRISTSDGRQVPVVLRLIYSGRVLEVLQGQTPFEQILAVSPPEQGKREFVRLEVTGPHRLLSNPIFVRRAG